MSCKNLFNIHLDGHSIVGTCCIKEKNVEEICDSFNKQFPNHSCVANTECPYFPHDACNLCPLFKQ